MLSEVFFWSKIDELDEDATFLQLDCATCQTTAGVTINSLREKCGESIISRNEPDSCAPRSCDLMSWDNFFWRYVKYKVYSNNPARFQDLEHKIRESKAAIPAETLHGVTENWSYGMNRCKKCRGSYLNDVLFESKIE